MTDYFSSEAALVSGPQHADCTVLLAHGAGAPMDSDFMANVAGGLAEHGLRVVRFEFPYMAARRQTGRKKPPDRQPVLRDTWLAAIDAYRGGPLVIGGKSLGGRIASLVADEAQVDGLVCLGYPFHPTGRPEKLRIEHLMSLATPTLILQGERDPFGNQTEVPGYKLPRKLQIQWLPDGDHSFKPRKSSGRTLDENLRAAIDAAAAFARKLVS